MMRLTICLFLLVLSGCSPRVHRSFEANRYLSGFSTYAVNPDQKMYFRSPGDIVYETGRAALESRLQGLGVNQVLFYGKSNLTPLYELYVLLNPRMGRVDLSAFDHVRDTSLQGRRFVFLGRGLQDPFPESDFRSISGSIARGKGVLEDLIPLSDILEEHARSTKFLAAVSEIAAYPVSYREDRGLQLQMELTYLSMMGDNTRFRKKIQEWEGGYATDPSVLRVLEDKAIRGPDAIRQYLLDQSSGKRLVMFSENHFYPWHRILLRDLLPGLRAQGFRYLALEALNADNLLNQGALPDPSTGFYTREQHYYRLLRTAQDLGFTFVSYDDFGQADREAAQAETLYQKTFAADPEARVLVLAGLDHIYERGGGGQARTRMAEVLKSKYGIDPLTISQTDLAVYRNVLETEIALIPSDSLESPRLRRVDLQLVNNLDWSDPPGDFRFTHEGDGAVQLALFRREGWLSDYGYLGDIPEFSMLLLPGESFSVALPEGAYQFLLFDTAGEVLQNERVPGIRDD